MESNHSPINRLTDLFERLNPKTLEDLDKFYCDTVTFSDPINQAQGIHQLKTVFADLFKQLQNIRIQVRHQSGNRDQGFIKWTMTYEFRGKRRSIDGVTFAAFNEHGLISEQSDYWDASFPIYGEFPLMTFIMRGIRRIVAVKHPE